MKLLLILSLIITSAFAESRKDEDNITYKLSRERREQVKNVEYFLNFSLDKGKESFGGVARLEIDLNHLRTPLSVDFLIKKIESIKVNGQLVKTFPKRRGSFDIPVKYLSQKMSVEVTYTGEYSKEASGFQRAKDPEDGSEYVFTDFEPYYAHWLYPSFDQPDLKGIFHVTVTAPTEWKVIHNELIEKEEGEGAFRTTTFRATKPISTYLFFLGAGPFVEWQDKYEDLPLYLYARKSLAKYVDHEKIMETTKKGLKFFNDYFGYPYPFSKYGHVFIPEFAWGGMENPGAVTLNERNIFRGPVPQTKFEKRNSLILHEMAHMWFGDLVTMEWWNDLWLNESFASYLAAVAQERAMDSKATWLDFFSGKTWGYWQDQLVSTHPIETDVPDVRTAKGNFDGITYAKGASSLKQLHFFVGEEGFRNGLRDYFKRYAFSNTKRQDFTGAIAMASKTDLTDWTSKWLQTAGPNRVMVVPECEGDKLKNVTITQKKSVSGNLSPHRTRLGFYEMDDEELELEWTKDVLYTGETTQVEEKKKRDCPDFILPNEKDLDYALFSLDDKSLAKAKVAISKLPDPLSRLMIWNIIYQMTRDSELSPSIFMHIALEALKLEEDDLLLGSLLGRFGNIKSVYTVYLDKEERAKIAPEFEALIWTRMEKAKEGSSLQMSFFDFFVTIAQSQMSVTKLFDMIVKNEPPKGITLDQDRRWSIILNLAANGHSQAMKILEEEKKRDPSTIGKRLAFAGKAAYPDKSQKELMWKELYTNKDLTHSDLEEAGMRMHGPNYPELSKPFLEAYFKKLTSINWKDHDDKVDVYFESFFPLVVCTDELRQMSLRYFERAKNLTSIARRSWSEAQDELNRCVKVRKLLPAKSDLQ